MKQFLLFTAMLLFANAATATPTNVVKEVTIAVTDVFVPEVVPRGADAKIVLTGMFPNSCYRFSRVDVSSPSEYTHEIKAKASVNMSTMCLMVLVPFTREVNLGQLASGEHTLRFTSGDDTFFEKKMTVE